MCYNTFVYDTYGNLLSRTGFTYVIFGYNGRDGVVTDANGLIYMRARYYSPEVKRFINADIVAGELSNAVTLNRFAYANGNPVSFIDPFGLSTISCFACALALTDGGSGNRSSTSVDQSNSNAERDVMMNQLSTEDLEAGITVIMIDGKYYYDYTAVVMNRLNEVLPDFYNHNILTYEEYIAKYGLKLFGKLYISIPSYEEYIGHVLGNLWFFYDEVNHKAPWDIKRKDPWKQQFGDIKMPYYDGNPLKSERFVFRGEIVTREDLGNITYGYLGSAMGIGDITLYWGGGVAAQGSKNIFSETVRDATKYYGDSQEDHIAIKKGIDFYYDDYPYETPGINRTFP